MNTNKIDLIREEVEKLHGNPYYMMAVKDVLAIIDSLQEEPVSEDLEIAANEWDAKASFNPFYMALDSNGNPYEVRQDYTTHAESFKAGAEWQRQQDQSTIEVAEDHAMLAGMNKMEQQMMANIWKPADGDELPEYEREVVVLTQKFPDDAGMMMVCIGHRPTPEGFDANILTTGKVEHYTPKTYDKGGWNIPNVKWWLDCLMPNMED